MKRALLWSGSVCVLAAMTPMTAGAQASGTEERPIRQGNSLKNTNGEQRAEADVDAKTVSADGSVGRSDDILVTGSRIRDPNGTSSAPILAVSSQELTLQSAFNVQDALNRLPQVKSDNTNTYNNGEGRQRLDLRALGFNRTLTLVDGQRLGESEGNDVNLIPVALVDRIDVLTGGASAVYGSDAIAGVVNFILKKDFEGVVANVNYGFYNHRNTDNIAATAARNFSYRVPNGWTNDGGRFDGNIAIGKNLDGGRGNISIYGGYSDRRAVLAGDRSFSVCPITLNGSTVVCQPPSSISAQGYFRALNGPAANGPIYTLAADGSRAFALRDAATAGFNRNDSYYFQRGGRRYNGGGFMNYTFDRAAQLFATVLFQRDESANQYAPGGVLALTANGQGDTLVNCNNPFLSASQAQALCGAAAGSNTDVRTDLRIRFGAPQQQRLINEAYRFTGGLRGEFGKSWHYDIGGVFASNRYANTQTSLQDPAKVVRALQVVNVNGTPTCRSVVDGKDPTCVPLDVFSLAGPSAAAINYVGYTGGTGVQRRNYDYYVGNANVAGNLGDYGIKSPWASTGVGVAAGYEHRYSTVKFRPDAVYQDLFDDKVRDINTFADDIYAEVRLPIASDRAGFRELSVGAAVRGSRYSLVPKMQSTYKFDATYRPVEDLMFRASYNKATRAPTIFELSSDSVLRGSTQRLSVGDPCAGTNPAASLAICRLTGVTDAQYGKIAQCADLTCGTREGGAGSVLPETARTATYGAVFTPRVVPGLALSVDYFTINVDQGIGYFYASDFVDTCVNTQVDFYCRQIVRNPDGTLFGSPTSSTGFVYAGTRNTVGKTWTRGFDLQGSYTRRFGFGRADVSYNGTILTKKGGDLGVPNTDFDLVGLFGPFAGAGVRKYQHNLRFTLSPDMEEGHASSISLNWRYIGKERYSRLSGQKVFGTDGTPIPDRFKYLPAFSYIDLSTSVTIQKTLTLRLTVNNLFDVTPPIRPQPPLQPLEQVNTIASLYDPLGRSINLGATLAF
ncbi:TonB-dependent receptor [Sphingomonas sp. A2-49]|uniref:TonB-dependent receptor domain-containing protein n=1 Tax=Sphingomonas sp. A2-49 TaxID=1391375 RepID=UPI0021D2DB30|nr:TonB-dependent receptor [Sphingomonas sp. A2-49]MCU6453901.1 TonB-dependent receptor [Sphingomonas sp. A2-49]